ncbi:MAG TPA: spermidine/putrescine ABC transporter substrate-binding protein [Chthoniobacterales bacterium]
MKRSALAPTIGALAAVVLLAGCDKPATTTQAPTPEPAPAEMAAPDATPAVAATPAAPTNTEEKVLNLYCWSEYVPQSVIDEFQKATGIKVAVENYASNEEMLTKLLAGGGTYDLIQPSEYVIEALIKEKLLEPLDHAAIPNLKNIAPEFQNMAFDPGNKYSVPWMAGTVGIVINTGLVKDDIKTYDDVFQAKNKGNIVVLDDAREIVSWALASQGIPINDVTDENLEKIKPILSKWLPLVKVYDSDSPKTSMLNGDVALGVVWSGEGALLLNEDKKFKWVLPVGAHLFVDSLAIPKGAKHPKNAEAFINFILLPEVSKLISADFPYLNPNAPARALLTPEEQANTASFPTAEELQKMEIFTDIGPQATKVDEIVTTVKSQ